MYQFFWYEEFESNLTIASLVGGMAYMSIPSNLEQPHFGASLYIFVININDSYMNHPVFNWSNETCLFYLLSEFIIQFLLLVVLY